MIRKNDQLLAYIKSLGSADIPMVEKLEFRPKERIFEQAQTLHYLYIIEKGLAKCSRIVEGGEEFIQEIFSHGSLLGEVECFSKQPSFAYCEAKTNLTAFRISHRDFQSLISKDPNFNELIITILCQKIRLKGIGHAFQQTHSLKENLELLQQELPELFKLFTKKEIANYLGITVRSLNRVLSPEK